MIKKFKKIITVCVLLVLATVLAVGNPAMNIIKVLAEADNKYSNNTSNSAIRDGYTFSVAGIPKTAKANSETATEIPKLDPALARKIGANGTGSTEATPATAMTTKVTVFKPNGVALQITDSGELRAGNEDFYHFYPRQAGIYKVQYAVLDTASLDADGNPDVDDYVWTVSNSYNIKVTSEKHEIKFIENDSHILPSTIDTNADRAVNDVVLPLPLLYSEDDQITQFIIGDYTESLYIAKYNTETFKYEIKSGADATALLSTTDYSLIIEVNNDNKNYINDEDEVTADPDQYIALAMYATGANKDYYHFNAEQGNNNITYRLKNKDNTRTLTETTKIIEGSNTYNSSNVNIGFTVDSQLTSASLNDKAYLKYPSAYDKNNSNASIDVYAEISVKHYKGLNEDGIAEYDNVDVNTDSEGTYFIPTVKGDYYIYYNVKDFYGNEGKTYYYVVKNVKDNTAPVLHVVDSFDIDDIEGTLDLTDKKSTVPTKMSLATSDTTGAAEGFVEITLPAIYAEDSVDNYSDFTFVRRISSADFVSSTASIYVQSDTTYTSFEEKTWSEYEVKDVTNPTTSKTVSKFYQTGTETEVSNLSAHKASQNATIQLFTGEGQREAKFGAGVYTIYYSVSDKSGNVATWSTTMTLYADQADETAPTVEFEDNSAIYLESDETVLLNKPTVSDDLDSNIFTKYYAFVPSGVTVGGVATAGPTYVELEVNEDDKIVLDPTFEVSHNSTVYPLYDFAVANDGLKIVAIAYDDYAGYRAENDGLNIEVVADPTASAFASAHPNIGVGFKSLKIRDVADEIAPEIYDRTATEVSSTFVQGEEISVQGIKVWDDNKNLTFRVSIKDGNGNLVPVYTTLGPVVKTELATNQQLYVVNGGESRVENAGYLYEYPGIKFTASLCTDYSITYTVTDNGNNMCAFTTVLPITKDTQKPVIKGVNDRYDLELGQQLSLENIAVEDNTNAELEATGVCVEESSYYDSETKLFSPQRLGTYTVRFSAEDGEGNQANDKTITINVQDKTAPVLELLAQPMKYSWFTTETEEASLQSNKIYIPGYFTSDEMNSVIDVQEGQLQSIAKVTITGPSTTYTIDGTTNKNTIFESAESSADNAKYYFYPTERGTYTITYNAEDCSSNPSVNSASPITLEYKVGETVLPTIALSAEDAEIIKSDIKVGGTFVLDTKTVVMDDNIKTYKKLVYNEETEMDEEVDTPVEFEITSLTMVDANGNTVEFEKSGDDDEIRTYTFETKGAYTLTLKTKDRAGNEGKAVYTINVVAEETTATENDTIVGTVLIVASLAVLAGVIIYFARGNKSSISKTEKKSVKKTTDK